MLRPDPLSTSLIARPALHRVAGVLAILAALWLAIGWAAALP
ncbi:hypothetical protein [Mangrovibrevibacter kandeliae]|nr:hypothetical protein [Aurantimonas sp. CSK15Z-1]MCQ8782921.1 hypothetical protein [Aurantimonas sp. CSK15Z-1]